MKTFLHLTIILLSFSVAAFGDISRDKLASSYGFFEYNERQLEAQIRREEANCNDKTWETCYYYARWNLCGVYRNDLRNRCRRSCNICGHETCAYTAYGCCWDMKTPAQGPNQIGCPMNCHNRFGLHKCHFLKANGACHKHEDLMQRMCKGVCNCDWISTNPATNCSLSEHGCCWDGATVADQNFTNCPVCGDWISERICKVFINLCTEYGVKSGWQMRKFCPKTCGVCNFSQKKLLNSYLEDLIKEAKIVNEIQKGRGNVT